MSQSRSFNDEIVNALRLYQCIDVEEIELDKAVYNHLYLLFINNDMMPYGVATGDTGEPDIFIQEYIVDNNLL